MINILENCTIYYINLDKIKNSELLNTLQEELGVDNNTGVYSIYGNILEDLAQKFNYQEVYDAIDFNMTEFDEDSLEDILLNSLGNWPHYLVFASGVRWNGNSGFAVFEDIKRTVYRDYDVTLELEEEIKDRGIKCRESSHDVPMGSTTYIIGISEDESEDIDEMDFDEVEHFVHSIFN